MMSTTDSPREKLNDMYKKTNVRDTVSSFILALWRISWVSKIVAYEFFAFSGVPEHESVYKCDTGQVKGKHQVEEQSERESFLEKGNYSPVEFFLRLVLGVRVPADSRDAEQQVDQSS